MVERILILEDNSERRDEFQENLKGLQIVIVEHAIHAINYLNNESWDVLFLDHDLGGKINVSTDETDTGSEVARWLVENPTKKPRVIVVHSLNTVGQIYIKNILPETVIMPFAWSKLTFQNLTEENLEVLHKTAQFQSDFLFRKE